MAKIVRIEIGDIIEFNYTSGVRTVRQYSGRVIFIPSCRKWCNVVDHGIIGINVDGSPMPVGVKSVYRDDIIGQKL